MKESKNHATRATTPPSTALHWMIPPHLVQQQVKITVTESRRRRRGVTTGPQPFFVIVHKRRMRVE